MYSTYRLKANEINQDFIDSIKKLFINKEVEIIIKDIDESLDFNDMLSVSSSSLEFWDNKIDDEVWNDS